MDNLRQEFEAFSKETNRFTFYVQTLRILYSHADPDEVKNRLRICPIFFEFHFALLLDRIYLGLRQFNDDSGLQDKRGNVYRNPRPNFTFRYFAEKLRDTGYSISDLEPLINQFNSLVEPASKSISKLMAHFDGEVRMERSKLKWLEPIEFHSACDLIPEITNKISFIGWKTTTTFISPNQDYDLDKLKRQFSLQIPRALTEFDDYNDET